MSFKYLFADKITKLIQQRDTYQKKLNEIEVLIEEEKIDPSVIQAIRYDRGGSIVRGKQIDPKVKLLIMMFDDLTVTIDRINNLINKTRAISTESQSEGAITGEMKINENLTDIVGDDVFMTQSGQTIGPELAMNHLLPLDDFFSRPVSIASFDMSVGDQPVNHYAVWDLYSKEPSVRAKLRNYSFLKADLIVRIVVSGSPFHYGKALMSYQPYAPFNDNLTNHHNQYLINSDWIYLLNNYLSQAPGAVTIDFSGNRPVEIRCPFISPKGMHRLYAASSSVLSHTSSYPDLQVAGDLYFSCLNQVSAVGSAPTSVGVHLYAWLENVELGPPTATQIEISTESASDERKSGPVERVSTALAVVSDALTGVPFLAPFARASSLILKGVSGLSAWFGWSKPHVLDEPHFVKNRPYCSSSNTIGRDSVEKISFDPLQEVTVDPRVVGSVHDEMSIAYLCGISSYIDTFGWGKDDAVMSSPLWESQVHPQLDTQINSGAFTNFQPSAMSFASMPFQYWRATIKFRFEIVCSRFHRGKLAFYYEPNMSQGSIIDASLSLNKQYIKIVDIQETQDVEFCVKHAQPYVWLMLYAAGQNDTMFGANFNYGSPLYNNGYIGVVPFTELQSPDGSTVSINVYVSADDVQYNMMTNANFPVHREILTESDNMGSKPEIGWTCVELNEASDTHKGTSQYCFGEQPISLRSCIKRYVSARATHGVLSGSTTNTLVYQDPIILLPQPLYSSASTSYSTSLLEYLPLAYLGCKGGMRKRIRFMSHTDGYDLVSGSGVLVQLDAPTGTPLAKSGSGPTQTANYATISEKGGAQFIPYTNGGVEVELPYYSPNLFHFSFSPTFGISEAPTGMWHPSWIMTFSTTIDWNWPSLDVGYAVDNAAAEDFTFMRYMGAPFYSA